MNATAIFVATLVAFGQREPAYRAGTVPVSLRAPSRVVWIGADAAPDVVCALTSVSRWRCDGASETSRGLVLIVGDEELAYEAIGVSADRLGAVVKKWGRLVVVTEGAVATEDLRSVALSVWAPERPAHRTQTNRLVPARESDVEVVRLANGIFWIAGNAMAADAFVRLDGPALGSQQFAAAALMDGPPDVPYYIQAAAPVTLDGRVRSNRGADVAGAEIELYALVPTTRDDSSEPFTARPMVRQATTRSGTDGDFAFERLASGPLLVTVIHSTFGRGTTVVTSLGEPAVVSLVPPVVATGRVIRSQVPLVGAKVRFVPAQAALIGSRDPKDLLAEEGTTGSDGRFTLPLPPLRTGEVQIVAADGASVRVGLTGSATSPEIRLGDIVVPNPRRLTVRLIDSTACRLSAVGPLGTLGLTVLNATSAGNVHWFEVPESGQWALFAECGAKSYAVEPMMVDVPSSGPDPVVDVRLVK